MSFFEALGVASQERIHTQFLAWILGPKTSPLQEHERTEVVRVLVGDAGRKLPVVSLTPLLVMTEVSHIDLVIVLGAQVVFIENKLKAGQSRGQLQRYNDTVRDILETPGHYGLWHGARAAIKVFLNFSGETNADGWRDVDYGQVARALRMLATNDPFVSSYRAFLARLRTYRSSFLRHHPAYPAVDRNAGLDSIGRLRAAAEQDLSAIERFLMLQRLDTVFCEALLYRLAARLPQQGLHQVSDTHGHALVQSTYFECRVHAAPEGVRFCVGTQLQRGTFKLNISAGEDYDRSVRAWIEPIEAQLNDAMEAHWPEAFGPYRENARTRAYRSWSTQLPASQQIEQMTLCTFAGSYAHKLEQARNAWWEILQRMQGLGCIDQITDVGPGVQLQAPNNAA